MFILKSTRRPQSSPPFNPLFLSRTQPRSRTHARSLSLFFLTQPEVTSEAPMLWCMCIRSRHHNCELTSQHDSQALPCIGRADLDQGQIHAHPTAQVVGTWRLLLSHCTADGMSFITSIHHESTVSRVWVISHHEIEYQIQGLLQAPQIQMALQRMCGIANQAYPHVKLSVVNTLRMF